VELFIPKRARADACPAAKGSQASLPRLMEEARAEGAQSRENEAAVAQNAHAAAGPLQEKNEAPGSESARGGAGMVGGIGVGGGEGAVGGRPESVEGGEGAGEKGQGKEGGEGKVDEPRAGGGKGGENVPGKGEGREGGDGDVDEPIAGGAAVTEFTPRDDVVNAKEEEVPMLDSL
jgi:hypothetical protein